MKRDRTHESTTATKSGWSYPPSAKHVRRLDVQGFDQLSPEQIARFYPWQRFAYSLCALGSLVALLAESPVALWIMGTVAAAGAIQPVHPFDLIYNHGIRQLIRGERVPPRAAPGRFACTLATVWLAATGYAFHVEATTLGYGLGLSLLAVAALVSAVDYCIPSVIWRSVFGFPPKRELEDEARNPSAGPLTPHADSHARSIR